MSERSGADVRAIEGVHVADPRRLGALRRPGGRAVRLQRHLDDHVAGQPRRLAEQRQGLGDVLDDV